MNKYFNYKSTTDLLDSVINGKSIKNERKEEEISLEKVLSFDGYSDPFQQAYLDNVKNGTYKFFATGDSNWDYYVDNNNYLYSIAKEPGCKSSHYGDMKHYNRMKRFHEENRKKLGIVE